MFQDDVDLLTREEAARLLRVSVRQLDRWLADGVLRAVRLGGVRVWRHHVTRLIEEMASPIGAREVALMLSVVPDDLELLIDKCDLPAEGVAGRRTFVRPMVARWLERTWPNDVVFGTVDDGAQELREQAQERFGVTVRPNAVHIALR